MYDSPSCSPPKIFNGTTTTNTTNNNNDRRGLGTHISRVRSVKMDSWSDVQMKRMKQGGNQQCKDFLARHNVDDFEARSIRERYDCPAAQLYKDVLTARIEGRPEPTELPPPPSSSTTTNAPKRKMEGFGSSPPPNNNGAGKWKLGAYVVASAFVVWYLTSHRK